MSNFKEDILREADGEEIIGVVIGAFGWGDYHKKPSVPAFQSGKLMTWEDALPILDYEYDAGWGAPDCHAIVAWTENKVLFVVQYDGSTNVCTVPRNPSDCEPDMPGG